MVVKEQHIGRALHDELEGSGDVDFAEGQFVAQDKPGLSEEVEFEGQVVFLIGEVVEEVGHVVELSHCCLHPLGGLAFGHSLDVLEEVVEDVPQEGTVFDQAHHLVPIVYTKGSNFELLQVVLRHYFLEDSHEQGSNCLILVLLDRRFYQVLAPQLEVRRKGKALGLHHNATMAADDPLLQVLLSDCVAAVALENVDPLMQVLPG